MKKRRALSGLFSLIFAGSVSWCTFTMPERVPVGEWAYTLIVNGVTVGTAKASNRIIENRYVSHSELHMEVGEVSNIARQTIVETLDFTPVRYESHNTIISSGKTQHIDTVATFRDRTVTLVTDNSSTTLTIAQDFRLEGNYLFSKLIEGKFKKGLSIQSAIYDPTIEQETTVPVTITVIGIEEVDLRGESKRLIHLSESIASVKSVDIYLDENGIVMKAVIRMLNTTIEIIKD